MSKIVDHHQIRERIMDSTVQTVAQFGIEGATSKRIAASSEVNESYLFRYFLGLEDLKEKAFLRVIVSWFQKVKVRIDVLPESRSDREVLDELFESLWQVLSENTTEVRFFIRFIQSESFTQDVRTLYAELCAKPLLLSSGTKTVWRLGEERLILVCTYANLFWGKEEKPIREEAYRLFFHT